MYIELIEYPDDKKWMGVKQRALVTVGKKVKTPPTEEWKRAILRARHSPIRYLFFSFISRICLHMFRPTVPAMYTRSPISSRSAMIDKTITTARKHRRKLLYA